MVTPNNYTVAIMVPATVPSAIMTVEIDAGAAIVIPVIIPAGADAETKTLSARYCWRCNRDGRERGENARNLFHVVSPIVVALKEKRVRQNDVPGTATELS